MDLPHRLPDFCLPRQDGQYQYTDKKKVDELEAELKKVLQGMASGGAAKRRKTKRGSDE